MIAVDTNVLVRLVVADDAEQTARARAWFAAQDEVLLQAAVCMELEWVLRACYKVERTVIHQAISTLCGQSNMVLDDPEQLANALDWYAAGLDFADALHLAGAQACDGLASFDLRLAKRAGKITGLHAGVISL